MIEFTSTEIIDGCDTSVCVKQGFIKLILEESDGVCEVTLKDSYATCVRETLDEIKAKLAVDSLSGEWQVWWLDLQLEENGKKFRVLLNKELVSLFYHDGNITKVETYEDGAMKCPVFHALNAYEDVKAQMEYTYSVARRKKKSAKNSDVGN